MDAGAHEIDVVMNIGKWKSGDVAYVERELRSVVEEVTSRSGLTKVILENSYLTQEEIRQACKVCERVGADFVKNGTGYGASSSSLENIALMRASVGPEIGVKVAGGVRNLDQLLAFRRAGATRVGTRSTEEILLEAQSRYK
jgi:deoxyribose-phosphate aldolase